MADRYGGGGLYEYSDFPVGSDDSRREDERDRMDDERQQAFERAMEEERRAFEQDRAFDDQDRAIQELLMSIINDPDVIMTPGGVVEHISRPSKITSTFRVSPAKPSGREVIRRSRQFSRANILPPLPKPRKKNKKHCKNLSECFKKANSSLRLKNGKLRKGKTQSDVAKMAHRLLKKMK